MTRGDDAVAWGRVFLPTVFSTLLPTLLLSGCLNARDIYTTRRAELTDSDGDGFTPDDGDCNDADPSVYPGATEVCDGVDQDCDGEVDHAYPHIEQLADRA